MVASSKQKAAFSPLGCLQKLQHMTEKPNKNQESFHFSSATAIIDVFNVNSFIILMTLPSYALVFMDVYFTYS